SFHTITFAVATIVFRLPPRSTLFPYTTLFRSSSRSDKQTAARFGRRFLRVRRSPGNRPRWSCPFHPISLLLRKETGWSPKETRLDRKSTRLNSSHVSISYAVFCLTKKKNNTTS